MRLRYASIARGALVIATMSVVIAACGGGGGTTGPAASPTAAGAGVNPVDQVDPLEGEWRAEYTCEDSLRAIESHLTRKQIHLQVGSLESAMGEWGGQPTKDDPCNGVPQPRQVIARFTDGDIALFDAETGGVMADPSRYELVADHSFSVPAGALCYPPLECPVIWKFDIANDELTFEVGAEVFQIMNWEAAPFHRVG